MTEYVPVFSETHRKVGNEMKRKNGIGFFCRILILMGMLFLASCAPLKNLGNIVGYNNNGAVDKSKMTEVPFERIHYGAAVIQYEDRFTFASGYERYGFPGLITTEEEWNTLQQKLNLELGEVDFETYVVLADYYADLFETTYCVPVYINYLGYCEEELLLMWDSSECVKFETKDDTDRLCGFDILKIKREDFPMKSRSVMGLANNTGDREEDTVYVESHGYCVFK